MRELKLASYQFTEYYLRYLGEMTKPNLTKSVRDKLEAIRRDLDASEDEIIWRMKCHLSLDDPDAED